MRHREEQHAKQRPGAQERVMYALMQADGPIAQPRLRALCGLTDGELARAIRSLAAKGAVAYVEDDCVGLVA